MKKSIICGVPMKAAIEKVVYTSDDKSLPASNHAVRYPVLSFLEQTMKADDDIKIILVVKLDQHGHHKENIDAFKSDFSEINTRIGANVEYSIIETDFEEAKDVHEQLIGKLVDALEPGNHIIVDTTYGPKDLPVVIFAALGFAEKFLNCTIDNIVYGRASFINGHPVNTRLCDMVPLYYLSSVTNTIRCDDPQKAKSMLHSLLSL